MLLMALSEAGFEVLQAVDGLDGLEALETRSAPDVIVTDINMPRLDGFGFIERLRQDPSLACDARSWCSPPRAIPPKRRAPREAGATGMDRQALQRRQAGGRAIRRVARLSGRPAGGSQRWPTWTRWKPSAPPSSRSVTSTLADLESGLLALERGAADAETVNAVFRAVHSIKGGAGAFGPRCAGPLRTCAGVNARPPSRRSARLLCRRPAGPAAWRPTSWRISSSQRATGRPRAGRQGGHNGV